MAASSVVVQSFFTERRRYSSEAVYSIYITKKLQMASSMSFDDVAADSGTSDKEEIEKETSWKGILQRELGFGAWVLALGLCSLGKKKDGESIAASAEEFLFQQRLELCSFLEDNASNEDVMQNLKLMLTWEDAYYDGNQLEKKLFNPASGSSIEGPYSHDPLGLAVAKMSYQVYSLGEGVVGKVAVSGKHSWIFLDELDSFSYEYFDGWQTQFSAGIKEQRDLRDAFQIDSSLFLISAPSLNQVPLPKGLQNPSILGTFSQKIHKRFPVLQTIVVVAVIPLGVVQLGSLHKISEDVKLVDHIKNVFSGLHDSLLGCTPSSMKSNTDDSCLPDSCTKIPDSTFHNSSIGKMKRSLHEDEMNLWSQFLSPLGESVNQFHVSPQIGDFSNKTLKNNMQERAGPSVPGNEISLPSSSANILSSQPQAPVMENPNNKKSGGETSDSRDLGKRPEITKNVKIENFNINDFETRHFENLRLPIKSSNRAAEMNIAPFGFCAGYELYEALGPSFQEQKNDSIWGAVNISEGIGSCSLLRGNSDGNLLEAVVARTGTHKRYDTENERSCRESLLTADKTPCNSLGTISSFDRDTSCSLNSVTCSVESLRGFPCTSSSIGSEHLDKARMPVKPNRKRARPGESSRPRPRDRQLIQDRIKELRELVPSGSKCSIDSLLERTIKHMVFLQSVTKHAEKLNKCSVSKLLDKETGIQRISCREQGSSWAVELGNSQKACPIIVENINMNGQMLVEMLSKESGHFLEIAETIRSLGLSILKGVSEAYGDQMWMCFVVEGENNRSIHRMDVLWSLMQLFQPKTSTT
ncbi:basic helix-loop-helix (bHLH) DNA-bindingsuperfamily protein [Striga asiatica]|uniref:Basic helix-loop-helix (BHLH) DNA-bindingsuperfamily protein n=1 Tax=Striga asiatica TaxID=4170 RepID=A0A5A7PAR8_STRAF|nr:basic helix-loop-helix (bHLH) DNA-bindingsuperfamily protein [Striga asiatica]